MMTSRLTQLALAGAAACALVLGPQGAGAQPPYSKPQPNKCEGALKKAEIKFNAAVKKGLTKCINAVRKDLDTNYPVEAATAATCDTAIGAFLYTGGTPPNVLAKALANCHKAAKSCTPRNLHLLGHLVSAGTPLPPATNTNPNAPSSSAPLAPTVAAEAHMDFTCRYILERALNNAYVALLGAVPAAQAQLGEAADVSTPTAPVTQFFRYQPSCATHACTVEAPPPNVNLYTPTIVPVSPYLLPLSVNGVLMVDVCTATGYANVAGENIILSGAQAKGLEPVNLGAATVCSTQMTAVGYCDCGTNDAPGYNYQVCRDSINGDGNECPTGGVVLSDDPGTSDNSVLLGYFTGTSVNGGCAGTIATAFKTVLAGQQGPDGVYCTPDDTASVLPATAIPFTTGTAQASIYDTNGTDGFLLNPAAAGGAPLSSCANGRASVLTGMEFSGAAIAMDGGATGDAIIELNLACQ